MAPEPHTAPCVKHHSPLLLVLLMASIPLLSLFLVIISASARFSSDSSEQQEYSITSRILYSGDYSIATSGTMAQSPSPAQAPPHKHKTKRNAKKLAVVFITGAVIGFIGGTIISLFYKAISVMIGGEGKGTGCAIFSPTIKPEDLSFLEKSDSLESLQVIGRGGCGEVYRAEITGINGARKMIAIKKINQPPMNAVDLTQKDIKVLNSKMRQIKAEIQIVGQIRHRNLLPLLAHISQPECHYLVYEFMKMGSLQGLINQVSEGSREPDWLLRHRIALGVATGLEYLHIDHSPHIIHRDLKPDNILLDEDMEARIADFGLSKVVPDFHTHITSSHVAGTLGYIAPEYHQTMRFTVKCDIYSFGVILGVLVTGRLPSDMHFQQSRHFGLVNWMRNVITSDDPKQAIDPKLVGSGYEEQMLLVLKIACYCTRDDPKERPDSKDVKCMLAQIEH